MSVKRKSNEEAAIKAAIAADADTRELTSEDFKQAVSVDRLPAAARKAIAGTRGKQKRPTKVATTIRLDSEVIEHYKAGGPGWQSRINKDLVQHVYRGRDIKSDSGQWVKRDSHSGRFISSKSKEGEKKRA